MARNLAAGLSTQILATLNGLRIRRQNPQAIVTMSTVGIPKGKPRSVRGIFEFRVHNLYASLRQILPSRLLRLQVLHRAGQECGIVEMPRAFA